MTLKPRSRWPLCLYAGLLFGVLAVNAVGFTASETLRRLGPVPLGKDVTYSTLVTDRNGKLLRPFITRDGYWRLPITADDVDPRFLAMLIAYEDKRFYDHHGVDPQALLRAAWQAATHRRIVSGGRRSPCRWRACWNRARSAALPTSWPR
jgi:penicillin-binding protein 1C